MTPDEAQQVARTIADTWPAAKLAAAVWQEPLEKLTLDQARTTWRWLRDHERHAPTIATFLAKNRELHTQPTTHTRTPCVTCEGTGWVHVETHRPGHPHPTTGVHPCRCPNGNQHQQAWRRAIDANQIATRAAERHETNDSTNAA